MKKKGLIALIVVLCIALAAGLYIIIKDELNSSNSSSSNKSTVSEESQDTEDADTTTEDSSSEESSDSSESSSSSSDIDASDPGNYDPTDSTKNTKASKLKKKAIGTWVQSGIQYSDGSTEGDGSSCTYVIKSDGTYTANGKTTAGKAYNTNGKWSVKNGKIVLGSTSLGFNSSGQLLKYTGTRDGKGYKLFYVYNKK